MHNIFILTLDLDPVPEATRPKASPSLTTRSIWTESPSNFEFCRSFSPARRRSWNLSLVWRCLFFGSKGCLLKNICWPKVVFPTAPKRSITCYKDMHSDRVESRGRSIRSIYAYFACIVHHHFHAFLLGGIQEDVGPWYWMHFSVVQQRWRLSLANLISSLVYFFVCSHVENQRFNECRVRCSTRGTTTSQTMRHLSYHLSSFCMFGVTMSGGTVRATKRTSYLWRIFKRRRQGYIPYWMPKQL